MLMKARRDGGAPRVWTRATRKDTTTTRTTPPPHSVDQEVVARLGLLLGVGEQLAEEGDGSARARRPALGGQGFGGQERAAVGRGRQLLADLAEDGDEQLVHVVVESGGRLLQLAVVLHGYRARV